ncbi:MAG: hemolysin III family protein [Salinibacter sp.]|uniref:PAQR family membrane homeostasis protein TrhA n=1 Tax=Salinibacter sp. TaxID=2065818 RepID=UPI0035D48196
MLTWNFEGDQREPVHDPTMAPHKRQSYEEELANAITHGIGLVLSVIGWIGLLLLSGLAGTGWDLAASVVFGGTLVFLYATSTLYHSAGTPRLKRTLRILDHVAIFLLIAGTYTPFAGVLMREGWGWTVLALAWGFALVGLLFKLLSEHRFHPAATSLYLLMGWFGVLLADPMRAALPIGALLLVAAGGLAYTIGTLFYGWHSLRYSHAIWHVFVLVGSACHYAAVVLYVL